MPGGRRFLSNYDFNCGVSPARARNSQRGANAARDKLREKAANGGVIVLPGPLNYCPLISRSLCKRAPSAKKRGEREEPRRREGRRERAASVRLTFIRKVHGVASNYAVDDPVR